MNILAFLLDSAFKSSILLGAAFLVTMGLRRQSASLRHIVWSAAVIASVALPIVRLVIPSLEPAALAPVVSLLSPGSQVPPSFSLGDGFVVNAVAASGWMFNASSVVLSVLLAGIAAGFVLLIGGSLRLMWIASRAEGFFDTRWLFASADLSRKFALRRPVRFLQHRGASMLVTWGILSPRVLLPSDVEQWPDHRVRAVLGHELAHVLRRDWFVQVVAEVARIIYWFNPLMWAACSRLKEEGERACDDVVLNLGVDETEYATNLLAVARALKHSHRTWSPALGMARPSNLERRFAAMLNRSLDRRSATGKAILLTALATLIIMLPLSALRSPAQVLGGRLTGTVTDTSGAPVANVTVIVSNAQARIRLMTTTNANGGYEFGSLPTGSFQLETISTQGYERPASAILMQPSLNLRQDLQMRKVSSAGQPRIVPPPPPPAPAIPFAGQRRGANAGELTGVVGGVLSGARGTETLGTPPPPPPPPPTRIRQGGNVQKSMLISEVKPIYPPGALAANIQGVIILEAVIDAEGNVVQLRVISGGNTADPNPDLSRAAVEAVSQWKYRPTHLNGVPVEVVTTITVNFAQ